MTYTTQQQVRAAYWDSCHPRFERIRGARQNDYSAEIRTDFCEFVDSLARQGHISEALAQRVTL
jgi:hypothetical protein